MKFKLTLTDMTDLSYKRLQKYEKLGFVISPPSDKFYPLYKAIGAPEIELSSLEELVELSKEYGELIIYQDTIEIFH
jgi:hypothetical protein